MRDSFSTNCFTYDAGGERTIKYVPARTDGRYSARNVGNADRFESIIYPNALVTAKTLDFIEEYKHRKDPKLVNYTKHYYIGGERIASSIGTWRGMGGYLGTERTSILDALNEKVEKAGQAIHDVFDHFGKHIQLPEPFVYTAEFGNPWYDFQDPEYFAEFWYHPDHLGSSSYITNLNGEISQHMEYLPFGETLIEEHLNSNNSPYKFNAKEFDAETGNYYYGARYYDPKWVIWLSVDPLAEETMQPYSYANNNPLRFADPTGMIGEDWVGRNNGDGTTSWSWDDNITSLEQAKAAGYDDYRAPGSIIDNGKINGQSGTGGQTSVYLGQDANDVSFTYPNSTVTPFQVGTEWLSGTGPRHRDFTNGDYFTELLRQHEHIGNARSTIIDNVANGGALTGSSPYELGGVQGVGLYIKDYSTLLTGGATGNLAVTYLGSYNLKWSATPNAENGTISVNFSVGNTSTMQSASRPPVIGYLPGWQNTVGRRINQAFQTGWGSKTSQSFNWTETLQMRK